MSYIHILVNYRMLILSTSIQSWNIYHLPVDTLKGKRFSNNIYLSNIFSRRSHFSLSHSNLDSAESWAHRTKAPNASCSPRNNKAGSKSMNNHWFPSPEHRRARAAHLRQRTPFHTCYRALSRPRRTPRRKKGDPPGRMGAYAFSSMADHTNPLEGDTLSQCELAQARTQNPHADLTISYVRYTVIY